MLVVPGCREPGEGIYLFGQVGGKVHEEVEREKTLAGELECVINELGTVEPRDLGEV